MTGTAAVEVTVHAAATPQNVFPYFTDPTRYVQWMGNRATLDSVPGGTYRVYAADGFRARHVPAGRAAASRCLHLGVRR